MQLLSAPMARFFSVLFWGSHSLVIPGRGAPPSPCHCERSEAIQSINLSQRDTYRIHWIATVALLPRDDKIYHPLSLRAIADGVAIQSINLSQRDAYLKKYDVIHITWIPWSSHGMTRWRKTRPRMTKKRIVRTKTALCTLNSELCTLSPSHGHKEL